MAMRPFILGLPPHLRRKIYYEADFFPDGAHYIVLAKQIDDFDSRLKKHQYHATYNLLLTCRLFYKEVSALLYTHGHFLLRIRQYDDFRFLLNLRPESIQYLKVLTVHLCITSCGRGTPHELCCRTGEPWEPYRRYYDNPISTLTTWHQQIFAGWSVAIQHILSNCKSNQLNLNLVCDVQDYSAAQLAVQPLYGNWVLASCAIRLSRFRDPVLRLIARRTVLQTTGTSLSDNFCLGFRFFDLPAEIRSRILEFTDLVTPFCEVEWSPKGGYRLSVHQNECDEYACPTYIHHSCQFMQCNRWSDGGCFCQQFHSAYALRCQCWAPPLPLFLVCREMRDEAEAIFFRSNRIIIAPTDGFHMLPKVYPDQFEASKFFNSIRTSALRHLRFLEIVFPPFESNYCPRESTVNTDWQDQVTRLKTLLCLPLLIVRVYFTTFEWHGQHVTEYHARLTKQRAMEVMTIYVRILRPLTQLVELKHLFIHATVLGRWTRFRRRKWEADIEYLPTITLAFEQKLGRVLLREQYERLTGGEDAYRVSKWFWDYDMAQRDPYGNPLLD